MIVGENGTLDIASGVLGPPRKEHYATRRVAFRIDPKATCPVWDRYLADNMGEGVAATLQEWFGASLIRKKPRDLSKGMIVYGPSRTGKTQVTKVLRALLGGNTCGLPVRAMEEHFGMQPLLSATGWVADDAVGEREHLQPERYKVIVTGEPVSVACKNTTSVEHSFDIPVLLTMNHYPVVKDSSNAVYNRTLVLPMMREWPEGGGEDIGDIVAREEMSGVLNWALEGWHRLRARGRFDPPAGMIAAAKEFKGQNNHLEAFAELCLEPAPLMYVTRVDLHRIFNNWLMSEIAPRNKISSKWLTKAVENGPIKAIPYRMNTGWVWVGIRFTEAALAFEEKEFGRADPTLGNLNHGVKPEMRDAIYPRGNTPKKGHF